MRRLPPLLLVPLLALAVALGGCNGDPDETSADATPASGTTAPSAPGSGAGTPQDGADTQDGSEAPDAGKAAAPGAGTRYCTLLGSDFTTLFDHVDGPRDAGRVVDLMRQVAASAPPRVRDDWRVLGGAFDEIQQALAKAAALQRRAEDKSLSPEELQRRSLRLMKRTQELNDPRSQAAGEAVARHAQRYCGISLGG